MDMPNGLGKYSMRTTSDCVLPFEKQPVCVFSTSLALVIELSQIAAAKLAFDTGNAV
jgi:hypothetical protein